MDEFAACNCLEFDHEELRKATDNFDNSCRIGEGHFGPVFRGSLKLTDVAIKILRTQRNGNVEANAQGEVGVDEQFMMEVKFLSRFRHPNLVTLIGFSREPKGLVYEYLPNSTLENALQIGYERFDGKPLERGIHLPWMCRMSIVVDIARGLAYLHTAERKRPLVHRDVKSANIFLDLSFRAKVGGIGLAYPLEEDKKEARTTQMVGTSGYIPPEGYQGIITTKTDTFAYGVILLELMTGMPSFDPRRSPKDLITYMEADMAEDRPNILCTKVDMHAGNWPISSFVGLFRVAKRCVESALKDRPEIIEIYPHLKELVADSAAKYEEQLTHSSKPKS